MKNVLMTMILFGGFFIAQLSAQSCVPSPLCPPGCCVASCCKSAGAAAASVNTTTQAQTGEVQIMPVALEVFSNCTPEQIAACKASGMSDEQIKACQIACASKSTASCSKKEMKACASKAIPSCSHSASASTKVNEAAIDKKYHENVKPTKS